MNSLNWLACVEGLETRRMLSGHPIAGGQIAAGNVTAVIVGSDVKITGDALANAISITAVGTSGTKIKITGLFGTKVNNGASATLSGVDDINIQMKDGNDSVAVTGLPLSGTLLIDGGNGTDTTTITGAAIGGLLKIRDHLGGDTVVVLATTVRGKTRISTGADADTINIDDSTFFGTVQIGTGPGADHVNIERNGSATGPVTTFRQDVDMRFADDNDLLDIGVSLQTGNRAIFQKAAHWDGGRGNSDFETRNNATFISGQPTIRRWEID